MQISPLSVLVISQYFFPENFRVNDLVSGLVARGHKVTVLTGQPNYPRGRFFTGYGWRGPTHERHLGAEILRVPLVSRGQAGRFRLILNYLSFAFFASVGTHLRLRGTFDAIFVFEPSPITVGIPAVLASRRFRAPILFWVLDLWPDSVQAAGAVSSRWVLSLVSRLVRWVYSHCRFVLIQSRDFTSNIASHGVPPKNIHYFPNWIETEYDSTSLNVGFGGFTLPSGFRIVYAGNIGAAQGFPEIIEAAAQVAQSNPDVHWIIAGDGRMASRVREEVARRGLENHVHFLGQLPASKMPELFASADGLLVSLRSDSTLSRTIPGKLQSYLASGKPVLAMLDGEGARVVRESGAGMTCPAGDSTGLARIVQELMKLPMEARAAMGAKGRRYAYTEFGREPLFDRLEIWLREVAAEKRAV